MITAAKRTTFTALKFRKIFGNFEVTPRNFQGNTKKKLKKNFKK